MNWEEQPLGQMPDRELADILNVSHTTIRRKRIALGIKPFFRKKGTINWDDQPLGEMPDADLARMLEVSKTAVYKQRTARGIKAYNPH